MKETCDYFTLFKYSLNQEQYLRNFLTEPEVPLDNNDAERSIKKFCVGKQAELMPWSEMLPDCCKQLKR